MKGGGMVWAYAEHGEINSKTNKIIAIKMNFILKLWIENDD
jgi:hypothetical protein